LASLSELFVKELQSLVVTRGPEEANEEGKSTYRPVILVVHAFEDQKAPLHHLRGDLSSIHATLILLACQGDRRRHPLSYLLSDTAPISTTASSASTTPATTPSTLSCW
jgi:hypothetical protein